MSEMKNKVMILEQWPFHVVDLTQISEWESRSIRDGLKTAIATSGTNLSKAKPSQGQEE